MSTFTWQENEDMNKDQSEYFFSMDDTVSSASTRVVAMGIGGMGKNAMENLARAEIEGLELYSVNTDMQALNKCRGSKPVQIGARRTGGKGAGGNSEIGRLSAEEDIEKLRGLIEGAELVFIAAGMGGGTGTGAAPVIAKLCRELGIMSIGTVTTPMKCEGPKRMDKACKGLDELNSNIDSLIVIENERLSLVMDDEDISIIEIFRRADEVLVDGVEAITRMINSHGYINLDLADLRNVLKRPDDHNCADALIGVGVAHGEGRAVKAALDALENPLLAKADIKGAANLLVNVAGNEDLGLNEAHEAMQTVVNAAGDSDREIFMGFVTDKAMGEKISVTVIATGMGLKTNNENGALPFSIVREQSKEPVSVIVPVKENKESVNYHKKEFKHEDRNRNELETNQDNHHKPLRTKPGMSPLVLRETWREPAYLRRECRHEEVIQEKNQPLVGNTDVRQEISNFMKTKRKNRRLFREPTLRMAC